MKITHRSSLFMTAALFVCFSAQNSSAVTIKFDELPEQTLSGLSRDGVTFGFQIGGFESGNAFFGTLGPDTLTYIEEEVLEGNAAGVLTLDFSTPQNYLAFGVALSIFENLSPGATVSLFDSSLSLLLQESVDTETHVDFSEGFFSYTGVDFTRAVISFNPAADRFALDNLTFESTSGQAVPDGGLSPWMVNAFLGTLLGIGTLHYKRSRSLNRHR